MPEYRRFIAYFYEYIDGKRRRNAGFVKAEQRNGSWKLHLQLRSMHWPEAGLHIYGFFRDQNNYTKQYLGKGYPRGDSMIRQLELGRNEGEQNFFGVEHMSGMWIPCEENRCFISNWEETELDVEGLRSADTAAQIAKDQPKESGEAFRTETAGRIEPAKKEKKAEDRTADMDEVEKNAAGERGNAAAVEGKARDEKGNWAGIEGNARGEEEDPAKVEGKARDEKGNWAGIEGNACEEEEERTKVEKKNAAAAEGEAERTAVRNGKARRGEITMEAMECSGAVNSAEGESSSSDRKREGEGDELHRGWTEKAWETLRVRAVRMRPFGEEDTTEWIRIGPGEVKWLGMQRWPIGQNSFLMQGFWQHRHLLLGKAADGSFFLGVPGRETPQIRGAAVRFGFPDFRGVRQNGSGRFGYWLRQIQSMPE